MKPSMIGCAIGVAMLLGSSARAETFPVHFEKDATSELDHIAVLIQPGAVSDPPGKEGLTHLLGDLLVRGTQSKSKAQLDETIDALGARLGAETRVESWCLRGNVLHKHLDRFLDLMVEVLTEPSFNEDSFHKVQREIQNEVLDELNSDRLLAQHHFDRWVFGSPHPYSRSIKGTPKSLASITLADVKNHYLKWFRGAYVSVAAVGPAEKQDFDGLVKTLRVLRPGRFSEDALKSLVVPDVVRSHVSRVQIVSKPERSQTQMVGGDLGVAPDDPRYPSLLVANYFFGGDTFTSQLIQEIREKHGWSYSASSHFELGAPARTWQFWVMPTPQNAATVYTRVIQMTEALGKDGLSASDFERSKRSLMNKAAFSFNSPLKRLENHILEINLKLQEGFVAKIHGEIRKLTWKKANEAIRSYFKNLHVAVTVVGSPDELKDSFAKAAQIELDRVETIDYRVE